MLPARLAVFFALAAASPARAQLEQLESLAPPKPQAPPQDPAQDEGDDLERKREDRARRDAGLEPRQPTPGEKRRRALFEETLVDRPLDFLLEVSIAGGFARTSGDKGGYTVDLTSHLNFAKRPNGAPLGATNFFYGARIAPFSGSGYYQGKPGRYGLTWFGPMLGVGKIDPVPPRGGASSGWLLSSGIAALSKTGSSRTAPTDKHSDFTAKGMTFDAPGLWLEARYLRILYGALGYDVVFGAQSGDERNFLYAGVAVAAWN